MIPVQDLFEVHMTVADLERAVAFYRDLVGLRLAHVESARHAAFFWIGLPATRCWDCGRQGPDHRP